MTDRKPRRVLIIVQNLPVPYDRRVWLESTTLAKAGYEVSVICPKAHGFTRSFEVLEDVHIYRYSLPVEGKGKLGLAFEFGWCFARTFLKSLKVAIAGRGFDVIHACNPPETYWMLAKLWRIFGKRFLFDHHDLSPELYEAKFHRADGIVYKTLVWLERMTFQTADAVISTNASYKRIGQQRGGVAPEDGFIVRSGPALERYKRYPAEEDWKQGKEHMLVYLGEIGKQDGVDHLMRALHHLRHDFGRDDVHMVLMGDGTFLPDVRQIADELGVSDMTTFTGRVTDDALLCRVLSSADIGVESSQKNAHSDYSTMNKVLEYMFFGLPIVCYDLTENRVSAGEAAVYAKADDELDLARRIDALLDDPETCKAMSEVGERRLHGELAWEYSVPHLLAAYDHVFARREARTAEAPIQPSAPAEGRDIPVQGN